MLGKVQTSRTYAAKLPWAIVQVGKFRLGISAEHLRQFLTLPEVTAVPGVPDYVRGVITLRGKVTPMVDLRLRLGLESMSRETGALNTLLEAREQDHRRWLDELRRSVAENTEFKLATDPHRCAFGKWYDTYRAEDPWIADLMKKFDEPHQSIHRLAGEVKELQKRNDYAAASRLIEGTGGACLALMIKLFTTLKSMLTEGRRETVAVLMIADRMVAAAVDAVLAVEHLTIDAPPEGSETASNTVCQRLGKRADGREFIPLIEPERILDPQCLDSLFAHTGEALSLDTSPA